MSDHVLTLSAPGGLEGRMVEAAGAALRAAGAHVGQQRWLAPEKACDLAFDGLEPGRAEAAVRVALDGAAVDLAAQPVAGRRKRLLVADMESTVIRNEMLDELADFAGQRPEVERITARAMAGELDFAGAVRARVRLLAGLPSTVLEQAMERLELDPGAARLVATMSAHGAFTALVSGGFGVFAAAVQRRLGFDLYRANELVVEDGRLSGDVVEPILGRDAKAVALGELCRLREVEAAAAVAVGDGANDLEMIAAAGLGVAYHAKPAVIAAARFSVRYGDLSTLLFYQGFDEASFVG